MGSSQPEFDKGVGSLKCATRLTGLALTCGREPAPEPYSIGKGAAPEPQATDLRGLAGIGWLRSLELTVPALSQISLGFPARLETLTVREFDLSAASLSHLRLPPRLRRLAVVSDNSASRDRLANLARGLGVVCEQRPTPPSKDDPWSPPPSRGRWVKEAGGAHPARLHVCGLLIDTGSDESLVPGYRVEGDVVTRDGKTVLRFDNIEGQLRLKGTALFSVEVVPDGMVLSLLPSETVSGIDPKYLEDHPGLAQPDDGSFRKAAERTIAGKWRRAGPTPQPTVIGEDDSRSPDVGSGAGGGAADRPRGAFPTMAVGLSAMAGLMLVGVVAARWMRRTPSDRCPAIPCSIAGDIRPTDAPV